MQKPPDATEADASAPVRDLLPDRLAHAWLERVRCQLRTWLGGAERAPAGGCARTPILLLHGFASSPRVLVSLERELHRRLDREVWSVRIDPGLRDLRHSAYDVAALVEELSLRPDFAYADVVGHSMGGLVATYLLKCVDRGERIRNVVTLGTPHRGAPLAPAAAWLLGGLRPALEQMRPRSPLVRELAWRPVPERCQLLSVAGGADRVVPERSTWLNPLPGHRNLCIPGVNHWGLLLSRPTVELVSGALRDTRLARPLEHAA